MILRKIFIPFTTLLFANQIIGVKISSTVLKSRPEDASLNFTQLAAKYGQPCEEHDVITEDGYIVKLFHLPGDKSRPVLMMHGNTGTADDYILRGVTSLPVALRNAGYDVWLGNSRGNRYSRRHVILDPDRDSQFWNFGLQEYGAYDLAGMIDYILDKTEQEQLYGIGYSVGTTQFYVLGAERPEYNAKIKLMISLAPICYTHNSVTLSTINAIGPALNTFVMSLGMEEYNGENSVNVRAVRKVCTDRAFAKKICLDLGLYPVVGYSKQIEADFVPVIFGHYPSSCSRKSQVHLYQIGNSRRFAKFDYGLGNLPRYRSIVSPEYALGLVTMRIALVSAKSDLASVLADVQLLKARLSNVVRHIILEPKSYSHLDFMWARNAPIVLYPHIFELLHTYI